MKASIFILIPLFLLNLDMPAQVSLERQVIGTTGQSSSSPTIQLSSTVGEAAVTTLISGTLVRTQGFQQDDRNFGGDAIEDLFELVVGYEVYPNPTSDFLMVRFESEKKVELHLQLFDLRGRKLSGYSQTVSGTGQLESQFSLSGLAEGLYLLSFMDTDGRVLISHKVRKI